MVEMAYGRVSSKEQNEGRQVEKFRKKGVDERYIFIDKISGTIFKREQYDMMKKIVRAGDLIYMDALDRLGRSYDGIIREWKHITRELNADIVILENEILFDSRKFKSMGDIGKLMEDQFLSLLSYVAEQERNKIKSRQAEGIALAKKNGVELGRPSISYETLSDRQKSTIKSNFDRWQKKEIKSVEFMKLLDLKKNTFYKIMKEYEEINS